MTVMGGIQSMIYTIKERELTIYVSSSKRFRYRVIDKYYVRKELNNVKRSGANTICKGSKHRVIDKYYLRKELDSVRRNGTNTICDIYH